MAHMATLSSKGQLVIPAKLRHELGLKPGVRVIFSKRGKSLLIEPGAYEAVLALRGNTQGCLWRRIWPKRVVKTRKKQRRK